MRNSDLYERAIGFDLVVELVTAVKEKSERLPHDASSMPMPHADEDLRHDASAHAAAASRHLNRSQSPTAADTSSDGHIRHAHAVEAIRNLAAGGYLNEAVGLGRTLLATPLPPGAAAEVRYAMADLLLLAGNVDAGVAEVESAIADPALPERLTAAATATRILGLHIREPDHAQAAAEPLLPPDDRPLETSDAVMAATVLSNTAWHRGDLTTGLRLGRRAARAANLTTIHAPVNATAGMRPLVWPKLTLASKLGEIGEYDEAEALITEAHRDVEHLGHTACRVAPKAVRSQLLLHAGRIAEAEAEATMAARVAQQVGTRLLLPLALTVLARTAAIAGKLTEADGHMRRCRAALTEGGGHFRAPQCEWVDIFLTARRDGAERAADALVGQHGNLAHQFSLPVREPGAPAWIVGIAQTAGRPTLAHQAVDAAARLAAANPTFPTVATAALHARSVLDRDPLGLAQAAVRHRDAWARDLASADLDALIVALQQTQSRPGRAQRCQQPIEAPRKLTAAEREVARLVARGLTNRQVATRLFISPHTVNYHLRGIFRKMDIRSRIEIVRIIDQIND